MVIEYARNVVGLDGANSAEFDDSTPYPVIATMADQREVVAGQRDMGGTMRLGLYPAKLLDGSVVREQYDEPYVEERHRHRFEVNNDYRAPAGGRRALVIRRLAGRSARRVRRAASPTSTRYYVATQAHPELRSRPTRAHPLFVGLVAAAWHASPNRSS